MRYIILYNGEIDIISTMNDIIYVRSIRIFLTGSSISTALHQNIILVECSRELKKNLIKIPSHINAFDVDQLHFQPTSDVSICMKF